MKIALRARTDGLLEPNSDRGVDWVQSQPPGALITLEAPKDARSDAQNRYMWGWVYANAVKLSNEAGYTIQGHMWTKDLAHAAMRECFLIESELWCEDIKQYLRVYKSTSQLSPVEFSNYIQNVKEWFYTNYDVSIPDPNEGYWLEVFRELER